MDWTSIWRRINEEQDHCPGLTGLRALARMVSWGYKGAAAAHHALYDLQWRQTIKVPTPVIGVGNLTVGGAGKTPLTAAIVESLLAMGWPVAVISRGYGREKADSTTWVSRGHGPLTSVRLSGDEPYMLASRLPVPILVGSDRVQLARMALAELGPVVIVGDDLFQHRRLYRDLDIVVMDATRPLGNGLALPRGPLRESASGLRRADAVVLTRANDQTAVHNSRVWLRSFWGAGPVLTCQHQITGLYSLDGQKLTSADSNPMLAFCGLANPCAFLNSLEQIGLNVVKLISFPDHHWFSRNDLENLSRQAVDMGVKALVTTEKDAARLQGNWPYNLPLWVSRLDLFFTQGDLRSLLQHSLNHWTKQIYAC